MTEEEKFSFQMNRNVKLSPLLIALAWDTFFIWTISTLFLSQVKGFSYSQIVMLDSFLMLFGAILCVPCAKVFKKLSSVNSIRIGMLGYAIFLLLYILGTKYVTFIFAQFFIAFGYAVCGIKSNSFANDTLTLLRRNKDYNKVFGSGMSLVYIFECVGAVIITYIYNASPNVALFVSLSVVVMGEILTFFVYDPEKYMPRNITVDARVEKTKKSNSSLKKDLLAPFIIWLLIFAFCVRGVTSICVTSYKIFLQQAQTNGLIKPWMFGYLFAICRLMSAIFSKYQFKLNLKYGMRTVSGFVSLLAFCFFVISISSIVAPKAYSTLVIVVITASVLCAIRIPLQILTSNYLNKFVKAGNTDQIYSIKMMIEYLGYTVGSFMFSRLLVGFDDSFGITNLVFILIYLIPLLISTIFFLRCLFIEFKKKQIIIKEEYTED